MADAGSTYAIEGTCAHALCEFKLKTALGIKAENPIENLDYYNAEMEQHAEDYKDFVLEVLETAKQKCSDPFIAIEQRIDYSAWAEDGFGTCDALVIADGSLHVIDFKYGKTYVEVEDNPQLKLYALGALALFDGLYDISNVSMTIFQPRLSSVNTVTCFKESIYQWADEVLKPTAKKAYAGEGELSSGKWCKYCKAKALCRKRRDDNMQLAALDFKEPTLLEDSEIEAVLAKLEQLTAWAKDVQTYAFNKALSGKKWNGWKLVRSRSNRKITDPERAAEVLRKNGFTAIFKSELLGLTELGKVVGGASKLNKMLDGIIVKPLGKPALVPESNKGEEYIPNNNAAEDFAEELADYED
jgi:hypothetical protein